MARCGCVAVDKNTDCMCGGTQHVAQAQKTPPESKQEMTWWLRLTQVPRKRDFIVSDGQKAHRR
jgi:hypothetical protein